MNRAENGKKRKKKYILDIINIYRLHSILENRLTLQIQALPY